MNDKIKSGLIVNMAINTSAVIAIGLVYGVFVLFGNNVRLLIVLDVTIFIVWVSFLILALLWIVRIHNA